MNNSFANISILILAVGLLQLPAQASAADNPCPAGQLPYKDVAKNLIANGADILNKDYKCVFQQKIDNAVLSGGCANPTEAPDFLRSITENKKSIDGINPEFACKLMKFIKAAPGKITVGVARYEVTASVATHGHAYCTQFQCKEGSNTHPLGCAADLLYDGKCRNTAKCAENPCNTIQSCVWAHQNAAKMGLQYRLMPGHPRFPGFTEPWHIELEGSDMTRCNGSVPGAGVNTGDGPQAAPLNGAVGNTLRNLFTPQPQPQFTPIASQPISTAQNPISAFQEPVVQVAPIASAPVTTVAPGGTSNTGEPSVADKLAAIIENVPVATSTATSGIPIIVSAADSKNIISMRQEEAQTVTEEGGSPLPQQTFSTEDLSSGASNIFSSDDTTGFSRILQLLKNSLLKLLALLQPFRNQTPQAEVHLM